MGAGYYGWFKASTPRRAKGGIKSQSRRGGFAQSWWAKRWIAVLEGFEIGARLARGRSYARNGQVTAIEIATGTVKARVQGSRPRPYEVTIKVRTLSKANWKELAAALGGQALYLARLLGGEMPQDIEAIFKTAGLSLFPAHRRDLQTECSCPDWSNPCKHVAAVYYLLGEEFDRDPFLIFRLRGMSREGFIELLGAGKCRTRKTAATRRRGQPAVVAVPAPQPLPADPAAFWGPGGEREAFNWDLRPPAISAAIPKRLGRVPFWRGERDFLDEMEEIYRSASELTEDLLAGERA